MIVECPRCRARYRVESDLLDEDQTFKCSRCGHIFAYQANGGTSAPEPSADDAAAPEAQQAPPPEPPAAPAAPAAAVPEPAKPEVKKPVARRDIESLSFQFKQPTAPAKPPEPEHAAPVIHREPEADSESEPELDDFRFEDDDIPPAPAPQATAARRRAIADEPRFVRGEEDLHDDEDEGGNAGRPYLVFLAVLGAVYALFTLNLLNHPTQAERLLASVPVVGDVLAEDHLLQVRVQLQDVEGAYQQIKDDRMVFIVSGRAVNASAEPLKGVQIESSLYDASGKPIETKSIYTGNAMSLKIVKDLSSKEISLLQRLEPPKRFEIRPGESAGFSVVFVSPPTGAKEFTARVVAAQSSAS